jgi:hypothetical protein
MTFVKMLSEKTTERAITRLRAQAGGALDGAAHRERLLVAVDEFRSIHVGEKVLREHATAFKRAIADMEALEAAGDPMEPHRATQYGRALEALYAKLGVALSKVPIAERGDAAEAAVKEARGLVEHISHDELAAPAIAAMSDLLGYGAGSGAAVSAAAARRAVTELIDATNGRAGATSAFNVFPNIVWHVEHKAPIAEADRRFERWSWIARAVADALPRTRFDQIEVANLTALVVAELEKAPKDDRGALERAAKRVYAGIAPALADARKKAAALPNNAVAKAALAAIDANPAGPASLGPALAALVQVASQHAKEADREKVAGWEAIGRIIGALSKTPAIESAAIYLGGKAAALVASPAARAVLREMGDDPAAIPGTLIRAATALSGIDLGRPEIRASIEAIEKLSPASALETALAIAPQIAPGFDVVPLLWAASQFAKRSSTAGGAALEMFAERFKMVQPALRAHLGDAESLPIAFAAARANLAEKLSAERAKEIATLSQQIANIAKDAAPLTELMPDADRHPGIITLSNIANCRWDPPGHYLVQLLQPIALIQAPPAAKLELARQAMFAANEISKLDRDPNTIWNRVLQDWRSALGQPAALHFAMRRGNAIDVKADKKADDDGVPVRFVREHAELPPELAFTAGIQLNSEQLAWLKAMIGAERSRMQIRNVRDMIFACLELNRKDVIEALRTSKAQHAVNAAVIAFIAAEYRAGRLKEVPLNDFVKALKKGDNPIAAIQKERAGIAAPVGPPVGDVVDEAAGMAAVEMLGMGKVQGDEETVASLKRALPDLQALLQGVQGANLREPMLACIKAMVDGTWPAIKYDNAAGRRALEGLTPEQKAIWMQEWVTPLNDQDAAPPPPPKNSDPALKRAMVLLEGVSKALPGEAKLEAPGMPPLAFDRESAERLTRALEETRKKLHGVKKGSKEHLELSVKAGPLAACLSVIELQLELRKLLKAGKIDIAATLVELKPTLEAARSGARKLGARGCSAAIERVLQAAPDVAPAKRSARRGVYAADDDNLEAWVTSFDAGCIASKHGGNRHSQVEFISGAQYRMLRVCVDTVGATRSMYRLYKCKMQGYEGHALFMDAPYYVNRGQQPTQEMYVLAYKHGLKKAMAMGVPFMFNGPQGDQAARDMGLQAKPLHVTVTLDRGNTGVHHTQGVPGMGYFTQFGNGNTVDVPINASVVMPNR